MTLEVRLPAIGIAERQDVVNAIHGRLDLLLLVTHFAGYLEHLARELNALMNAAGISIQYEARANRVSQRVRVIDASCHGEGIDLHRSEFVFGRRSLAGHHEVPHQAYP